MIVKIILAISLVGFLVFESCNLIRAIKQRRRAKIEQKNAQQSAAAEVDDIEKSDKGVNE